MIKLKIFDAIKMGYIMSKFGLIDTAVLVMFAWGAIIGFTRGINKQIVRFLSIFVTIVLTIHYYDVIYQIIDRNTNIAEIPVRMTIFAVLFVLISIVSRLFLSAVSKLGAIQFTYVLERFIDCVLGAISSVLFFCMLSVFVIMLDIPEVNTLYNDTSISGKVLLRVPQYIHNYSVTVGKALIDGIKTSNEIKLEKIEPAQ